VSLRVLATGKHHFIGFVDTVLPLLIAVSGLAVASLCTVHLVMVWVTPINLDDPRVLANPIAYGSAPLLWSVVDGGAIVVAIVLMVVGIYAFRRRPRSLRDRGENTVM
jgi:hypothetical protein